MDNSAWRTYMCNCSVISRNGEMPFFVLHVTLESEFVSSRKLTSHKLLRIMLGIACQVPDVNQMSQLHQQNSTHLQRKHVLGDSFRSAGILIWTDIQERKRGGKNVTKNPKYTGINRKTRSALTANSIFNRQMCCNTTVHLRAFLPASVHENGWWIGSRETCS